MTAFGALRSYQANVLRGLSVAIGSGPGRTFTVMFPRQSGKNEVSAALVAGRVLTHGARGGSVVVCAPTLHPQATISFERTAAMVRRWGPHLGHVVRIEGSTIHCGAASAVFLSGAPGANVAGHTADLLLVGDEAQDLDEEWFTRQFRPMTASTGACTVLFGTPWQGDSMLEKHARHNRERDLLQKGTVEKDYALWDYRVDWREVGRLRPEYGAFVRAERERLGAQRPIYLSQYELRSVEAEGRLLSAGQLWALEGPFGPLEAPLQGERYVAGLDFAGEGANGDATVLCIGRMVDGACEIVAARAWRGAPFEAVTGEVAALARQWRFERLVCDATGMGAPLTAGLKKQLGRSVEPFVFSQQAKSALGFELLAAAGTGSLRIAPPMDAALGQLWDELRACRSEALPGGILSWSAPPGGHDDCVAALALCLRAASAQGPLRVAKGRSRE